eukprot:gnl/MRDRNA2_/MRDRNA2_109282_c0_seq1.p1 gnl/MRDRNA2_/MRDRNA2_109282_c0~~gnl/MRDRNA2_/MRDRNA2_109282_c0_seq1.p1  ORF type:complete len:952 (+),score=167.88 gnl/MRDRNA2_/MRDRNA2_109282_c0_seq1:206-3061(+)
MNFDHALHLSGVSGASSSSVCCDALFIQKKDLDMIEVFLIGTSANAVPSVKLRVVPLCSILSVSPVFHQRCLDSSGRFLVSQVELAERLRNGRMLTAAQKVAISDAVTVSAWETFIRFVNESPQDQREISISLGNVNGCRKQQIHKEIDTLQRQMVNLSLCNDKASHACLAAQVASVLASIQSCIPGSSSSSNEAVAIKTRLGVALSSNGDGLLTHGVAVISHLRQLVEAYIPEPIEDNTIGCFEMLQLLLLSVSLYAERLVDLCLSTIAQRWPEVVLCPGKLRVSVPNAGAMLSLLPQAMQEQLGCLLGTTPIGRSLLEHEQRKDEIVNTQHLNVVQFSPIHTEKKTAEEQPLGPHQSCMGAEQLGDAVHTICEENTKTVTLGASHEVQSPQEATASTKETESVPGSINSAGHHLLSLLKQRVSARENNTLNRQNLFDQRARQLQQQLQKLPVPVVGHAGGITACSTESNTVSTCDPQWSQVLHPSSEPSPSIVLAESKLRQPMQRSSSRQSRAGQNDVPNETHEESDSLDCPPPLQVKCNQSAVGAEMNHSRMKGRSGSKETLPDPADICCKMDPLRNIKNVPAAEQEFRQRSASMEKLIARKFLNGSIKSNTAVAAKNAETEVSDRDSLRKRVAHDHPRTGHEKGQSNQIQQSMTSKAAALAAMWLASDSAPTIQSATGSDLLQPESQEDEVMELEHKNCEFGNCNGRNVTGSNRALDMMAAPENARKCPKTFEQEASGQRKQPVNVASQGAGNLPKKNFSSSVMGFAGGCHSQPDSEESEMERVQRSSSVEASAVRRAQRRLAERRRKMQQATASLLSESEARRAEQFRKRDERIRNFMRRQEESATKNAILQNGSGHSSVDLDSFTDIPKSTPSPGCSGARSCTDGALSTPSDCKTPGDSTVLPEARTPSPPSRVASKMVQLPVSSDLETDDVCQPRTAPPQPHPM